MLGLGRNTVENILKQLKQIIRELLKIDSVGILYSGGLDSSVIAKILTNYLSPSSIVAVCVGLPNSYDLQNAIKGATELGLQLQPCFLTKDLVVESIQSLKQMNVIHNPVDLTISIPMFLGMKTLSNNRQINTVFLGQGADELFGGYEKYEQLYEKYGEEATNKTMISDLKNLLDHQVPMERRIAEFLNINTFYPFLDPRMISSIQSLPVTSHIIRSSQGTITRKALLRKMATKLSLSETITTQPKKAIQYGSGTVKLLRKYVKSIGYKNIPYWFQACFQSKP